VKILRSQFKMVSLKIKDPEKKSSTLFSTGKINRVRALRKEARNSPEVAASRQLSGGGHCILVKFCLAFG